MAIDNSGLGNIGLKEVWTDDFVQPKIQGKHAFFGMHWKPVELISSNFVCSRQLIWQMLLQQNGFYLMTKFGSAFC